MDASCDAMATLRKYLYLLYHQFYSLNRSFVLFASRISVIERVRATSAQGGDASRRRRREKYRQARRGERQRRRAFRHTYHAGDA